MTLYRVFGFNPDLNITVDVFEENDVEAENTVQLFIAGGYVQVQSLKYVVPKDKKDFVKWLNENLKTPITCNWSASSSSGVSLAYNGSTAVIGYQGEGPQGHDDSGQEGAALK